MSLKPKKIKNPLAALSVTHRARQVQLNPLLRARIYIPAEITKTKKKRLSFISTEAKNHLDEWITFRPEFIKQANKRGK